MEIPKRRLEFGEELWPDGLWNYSHSWDSKRGQKMTSWGGGVVMRKKRKSEYSLPFRKEGRKGNKEGERIGSKKDSQLSWTEGHGLKGSGFNRQNVD